MYSRGGGGYSVICISELSGGRTEVTVLVVCRLSVLVSCREAGLK